MSVVHRQISLCISNYTPIGKTPPPQGGRRATAIDKRQPIYRHLVHHYFASSVYWIKTKKEQEYFFKSPLRSNAIAIAMFRSNIFQF